VRWHLVGTASRSRFQILPVAEFSSIAGRRAQCFVARATASVAVSRSHRLVAAPPAGRFARLPFWQCLRSRAKLSLGRYRAATVCSLGYHPGSRLRSPIQFRAERPSLPFTSPRAAITLQMQQVKASFARSAGSRASRLATSLSSCGGWRTRVAPNPSVKGTGLRPAPYVER